MTPVVTKFSELTEGDLCRVQFKSVTESGSWRLMECVAVWLARTNGGVDTQWSLRPEAGTMTIPRTHLVEVEIVKPAAARRGQRGDEGAKLPKSLGRTTSPERRG